MRALGMVGESSTMKGVFRSIIRFSSISDLPVLITGETGTGKEGLARAVQKPETFFRKDRQKRGTFFPPQHTSARATD
jgi:transcriptional regulator with GAF, ATPase, and Fis domain